MIHGVVVLYFADRTVLLVTEHVVWRRIVIDDPARVVGRNRARRGDAARNERPQHVLSGRHVREFEVPVPVGHGLAQIARCPRREGKRPHAGLVDGARERECPHVAPLHCRQQINFVVAILEAGGRADHHEIEAPRNAARPLRVVRRKLARARKLEERIEHVGRNRDRFGQSDPARPENARCERGGGEPVSHRCAAGRPSCICALGRTTPRCQGRCSPRSAYA